MTSLAVVVVVVPFLPLAVPLLAVLGIPIRFRIDLRSCLLRRGHLDVQWQLTRQGFRESQG